ncbi:MAG: M18 family aminopeptidase [Gammaproteobacteria bacterium]|nr:M18 family aminopeptidase [Gammaproteobacteria bacterium]
MQTDLFNPALLQFIDRSPTPFHATAELAGRLAAAGYQALDETCEWQPVAGGRYYVTRNDSSLVAFNVGTAPVVDSGMRLAGAHTDSPCLRVRPQPEIRAHGYLQLGVEVYGGVLLNPWFDRELSLAGRVTYLTVDGKRESRLIDFKRPICIIPSLAIHLDREANKNRQINAQTQVVPVVAMVSDDQPDFRTLLHQQLISEHQLAPTVNVLDYDLSLYDTHGGAQVGLNGEFIASARLDNLLSCFCGMQAMLDSTHTTTSILVCNDHEEVGSNSTAGARGDLLRSVIMRLTGGGEAMARTVARSWLISTDNAHGIHPNHPDRHDGRHGPLLNAGPVIKVNHGQSYATNSETSAMFRHLCEMSKVPCQSFVARNDMGCGSTIGPLTATLTGIRTVDVGVPTFAMHSIRELAGSRDAHALYEVLKTYFSVADL